VKITQNVALPTFFVKTSLQPKPWKKVAKELIYLMVICYVVIAMFNGYMLYFVVIWYVFLVLVYCMRKNLASLTRNAITEPHQADQKLALP
jgi:uncharacterized membrane protein